MSVVQLDCIPKVYLVRPGSLGCYVTVLSGDALSDIEKLGSLLGDPGF